MTPGEGTQRAGCDRSVLRDGSRVDDVTAREKGCSSHGFGVLSPEKDKRKLTGGGLSPLQC